ncbi:peptidoglycan D,D-transpeptidase FtsI family protein [Paenibacillus terreus]|uniref:Peptidoglycan D,D-transpeptidase FtsI family protein n=1 Tax=Paenibacillus terreus TaxID=1387834 RepID=A0ABV5BFJ1_9BACL
MQNQTNRIERHQRIQYVTAILSILIVILILRLGWIQTVFGRSTVPNGSRTVREQAVIQRQEGIVVDAGRGDFTDRFGHSITGTWVRVPVLFPGGPVKQDDSLKQLARILHTDAAELLHRWRGLGSPLIWKDSSGSPLELSEREAAYVARLAPGAIEALPYRRRYNRTANGMQWLGFLYERPEDSYHTESGAAGLEKMLQPLLKGEGETVISHLVDAQRHTLPDTGLRMSKPANSYYPLQVQTTIDLALQRKIEDLTEHSPMKEGAVVVLDAGNADVLAMVSRPFYDPQHVNPQDSEWSNRAVKAAVPGSIFKIVTAAAALEAGAAKEGETFHCRGEYGAYGLACWKEEGHGTLSLEQGFAESCNTVFAKLAERLSTRQLTQMAEALGLGQQIGWQSENLAGMKQLRLFDGEEAGRIFDSRIKAEDTGARVQTAIGQRDVRMTPLQAANLVVTLLHNGEVRSPRLVRRIQYANGGTLLELPAHALPAAKGTIHPHTAHTLLHWMEKVVQEGTGKGLASAKWRLAGKSGTAQTGQAGRAVNHQWFIGYGPVENPRYAVAVLVQNVPADTPNQATKLFGQVMDLLASSEGGVSSS